MGQADNGMIEYKEPSGPEHFGLAYQIKDERMKPVEVIRRNIFNPDEEIKDTLESQE